jgi:hypothetical protein
MGTHDTVTGDLTIASVDAQHPDAALLIRNPGSLAHRAPMSRGR